MAALSVSTNCMSLSCGNKTYVIFYSGETKCFEAPLTEKVIPAELDESKSENFSTGIESSINDSSLCLVCSDISSCGKWLVFCSSSKYLSFWDLSDCRLLSNRHLIRSASQVKFTPSADYIIVADKSGDVYQFSTSDALTPGKLILGHMSMLLDVLISSNEQYIITCDRDEKIRVSCFPNSYNIKSYCLGHEEFITSICFLPHDENMLISASGDGSLRLWKYSTGNEIAKVECYKEIPNITSVLAVTGLTASDINSCSSIVCATVNDFKGCLLYIIKQDNHKFTFNFIHVIHLQFIPWSIKISHTKVLWILSTSEKINLQAKCWSMDANTFIETDNKSIQNMIMSIQKLEIVNKLNTSDFVTLLYKKKFDNVQAYLDKKQARLLAEPVNKKIKNE